jgi:putative membrane protein
MKTLLITLASAALLVGCASHHEASMGASGSDSTAAGVAGVTKAGDSSGQLSASDARFVRSAAEAGMAEVRMGQLITEGAQSSALHDFGQRIVKDHTKVNQELIKIAVSKGMAVPNQPDNKHQKMLTDLAKLKGAEFDKMAKHQAVMDHQDAVRLFDKASQTLQDSELKTFAQKTLPTLKEHLELAKGLEGGATTSSEPSTSSNSSTSAQPPDKGTSPEQK